MSRTQYRAQSNGKIAVCATRTYRTICLKEFLQDHCCNAVFHKLHLALQQSTMQLASSLKDDAAIHRQNSAPLWRRFAALAYDSLILIALSMVYGALITALGIGLESAGWNGAGNKGIQAEQAAKTMPEGLVANSLSTNDLDPNNITSNYTASNSAPSEAYQPMFKTGSLGELVLIGWILFFAAFYIFFWRTSGQTLGMKAWRIRLIADNTENKRPSIIQCAQRAAWGVMSLAIAGSGYWYRFFSPTGQCLHDKLTRTHVIFIPETQKTAKI